jgi:RNA polymerase sigma factor (sigma-70 family)
MSDQELLAMVKSFLANRSAAASAGESLAWEEFFVTYDVVVRATIRKLHKALDIIDDVAQDVWIILIRKLPKLKFDPVLGSIAAWVAKIAQRLATKRARRHSRQQHGSLSAERGNSLVDPEPGPDMEFEWMQEHELFGSLVLVFAGTLPEREGRIVVLRFVESQAVVEIARKLGVSEDCVWSVLHRIIPKLRDFLRRRGITRLEK